MNDPIEYLLSKGFITGLYNGEDESQWSSFIERVNKIITNPSTPKNMVANPIRTDKSLERLLVENRIMWNNDRPVQELFTIVKAIEYNRFGKVRAVRRQLAKAKSELKLLRNPNTTYYVKLSKQLKLSSENVTMYDLEVHKSKQVDDIKLRLIETIQHRDANPDWRKFVKLKMCLGPHRIRWKEMASSMTKKSLDMSRRLEQDIQVVDEVALREDIGKNYTVHRNVYWDNCDGEIDVVIKCENGKLILVECKAKIFDIIYAWHQSGPYRSEAKVSITLDGVSHNVPRNCPVYIVSVIPHNEYILPFESTIRKIIGNKYRYDMSASDAFEQARLAIPRGSMSPLQWYRLHKDIIIIIDVKQ